MPYLPEVSLNPRRCPVKIKIMQSSAIARSVAFLTKVEEFK